MIICSCLLITLFLLSFLGIYLHFRASYSEYEKGFFMFPPINKEMEIRRTRQVKLRAFGTIRSIIPEVVKREEKDNR